MTHLLQQYPVDPSLAHLFSSIENIAFQRQHTVVHPAHVAVVVAENRLFGQALLGSAGHDEALESIRGRAEAALDEHVACQQVSTELSLHPQTREILDAAVLQAQQVGAAKVGVDHFALALLHNDDFCDRLVRLDERAWREAAAAASDRLKTRRKTVITHTPTLDMHSCDLTKQVREGLLPWPVCGRETEQLRLQRVLLRRTKRNPLLVGPAGTGKTTLLAGLAAALLENPMFSHCRVCELDLASLIAGTVYRGELEARLKRVLKELHDNPSVVLAIDEVHLLQSGGSETSANCAEFFKPALARGEICMIGATCPEHLHLLFRDSAMERRFEPIFIEPLCTQAVRHVLASVRTNLAAHYATTLGVEVKVSDDVLDDIPATAANSLPARAEPDASITILQDAITAALVPNARADNGDARTKVVVGHAHVRDVVQSLDHTARMLSSALREFHTHANALDEGRRAVRTDTLAHLPQEA